MNELTTLPAADMTIAPLNSAQLRARLAVIQDVMRNVMKVDQDYGVIPGTDKPTLYKPGAEKLCVTFRLSAGKPAIDAVPDYAGDIRYRVEVPIMAPDGAVIAVGVGECSTGEEKYRWRRPVHENEFLATPEDQRREKWTRSGDVWRQVRVSPADVANTVLKMAHKRAYVHAVIMATAAGAIFTQDVEDLPEGVAQDEREARPKVQEPQRKAAPTAPAGSGSTKALGIRGVTEKRGENEKGPWTLYGIVADDGKTYKTFDAEIARLARDAKASNARLEITFTESKFGRDIQGVAHPLEREVGAEG